MHPVTFWNCTMYNDVYEPVAYTTGMTGTAAVKLEAPQLPWLVSNYGLLLLNNNPSIVLKHGIQWNLPSQTSPNHGGHLTWSQLKLY